MATALTLKTSHPALLANGLMTPPLTPTNPICQKPIAPTTPVASYKQLRAHHTAAVRHVITKIRWEQQNSGYLRGEDAWLGSNLIINKLEKELKDIESAQKGLDRFPNCHAPTAFPKEHGPLSKQQKDAEETAAADKWKETNHKLEDRYPWIKQLFIGPMTKQQARNDIKLRELMAEGDGEMSDIEALLPSENWGVLMNKIGGGPKPKAGPKKSYEQQRMEKEQAKIDAALKEAGIAESTKEAGAAKAFGPITKEEWLATLPKFGPMTKGEYLLPAQREQRHVILTWLREPWREYDHDVAEMMDKMGRMALKRMRGEAKTGKATKAEKVEQVA